MPAVNISGNGQKRLQINKSTELLHLDGENPRLSQEAKDCSQFELLSILHKGFNLEELADSMAQNGYFDEEPLVAIPQSLPKKSTTGKADHAFRDYISNDDTALIVVEGNRRLATVKLLLDSQLRAKLRIKSWPTISEKIKAELQTLPVIVYRERSEVLPYLGVRHIVGIQRWGAYSKARYIVKMINDGRAIKDIEGQIGDKQSAVVKNYVCYRLLKQVADEFDFDTDAAEEDFSLLLLAIGQGNIKRYLGLPKKLAEVNYDEPVSKDHVENLKNVMSWIFGDGKKERPVIKDSRDITTYLSHVVASDEAVSYLTTNRDLVAAYDRSDGEETMLLKYIALANSRLESALGIAHRHNTAEVILEAEKCERTAKELVKAVRRSGD
ncbi:MAG: hypothetical protein NTX75_00355 [Proteobacteria bacterium]|nr:hypothetical protein [Pseudomonadota bacterium]